MFAAFLATLPIYAPNQLLFETEFLREADFIPFFANALLGASTAFGIVVAVASARGYLGVILQRGVVLASSVAYVAGYGVFALAAAVGGGFAQPLAGMVAGLLLAVSTVVLSVAWGAYLAQFSMRQALLWLAVMVGVAAMVELLLSSVTLAVGLIVFAVLVPLACLLPCWLAWKGHQGASASAEVEVRAIPKAGAAGQLRSMAQVVAMPFVGLMVFAFIMGARKFVLFDVVHMEVLGCVLGAVMVLPICFLRTRLPLMPLIYRVLVPLFALVLIFLNSFPGSTGPLWLAGWMSYAFYGAVAILALAGLTAAAHASEFSAGLIFGATVAGFSGCSLLGVLAARTAPFQIEGGGPALLVVSTLYFVYLLASALLAPWRRDGGDIKLDEDGAVGSAPVRDVAARCDDLAASCGLTPRESEILGYLGRGHGIVFVADALVISESTVRTHVKSIYRKLGVSSREELVSKVDEG